ncbi:hypothetical protein Tco_1437045 [Tanacetum coccineum]
MILCVTAQVITVLNGVIHYLLGYLLSFRELPAKVNKARGAMIHWESIIEESTLKIWGLITLWGQLLASEPRAFLGELKYEGYRREAYQRVIVLESTTRTPLQPVAPPSPDFILGPENPQTPAVPQDEDEREPLFIQAHDPNYVPEPIYPEYISFGDRHFGGKVFFFSDEDTAIYSCRFTPLRVTRITLLVDFPRGGSRRGTRDRESEDGPVDYLWMEVDVGLMMTGDSSRMTQG